MRGSLRSHLPAAPLLAAVVGVVATSIVLLSPLYSTTVGLYVDDVGLAVAAAAAAVCAARRARLWTGAARRAWSAVALGCAAYAAGEGWWTWLQAVRHTQPFPSLADIGYLSLPVAACVALWSHPVTRATGERGRRSIDAVMVTTAFATVSWELVLRSVVDSRAESRLALGLSLAYPVCDVVLLSFAVMTVTRLGRDVVSWRVLVFGLAFLAAADTGFAYMAAVGRDEGGLVDLCYIVSFIVLALATFVRDRAPDSDPATVHVEAPETRGEGATELPQTSLLPYLPTLIALTVTLVLVLHGKAPDSGEIVLLVVSVCALLARQYLAVYKITSLTMALAANESRLRHQAFHDGLTGLANRALFQDRLTHALDRHRRDLRAISVLFLDLDDFKLVNDTYGHLMGDELLAQVASRFGEHIRDGDTVARLGGDEFAVLLEEGDDPEPIAARLLAALNRPVTVGKLELPVSASIGFVSLGPETAPMTADEVMTHADTSMYAAKRAGKGQFAAYSEGMSLVELEEIALTGALLEGIANGAVRALYQPIIDLETGSVRGLEALTRWTYQGREIPPSTFIPLAERNSAIGALTWWVLDEACAALARWSQELGHQQLMVGINVPPKELTASGFVARVATALRRNGLRPGQLVIEITENDVFDDNERARQIIADLHAVGAQVSLDDFGVGYSSLGRLHALRLDSVKIDRTFVDHIDEDPEQARFVQAILNLGRELELPIIAEGIERPGQLALLRQMGGTLGQGWHFAKAMPPDQVISYLKDNDPAIAALPA